MLRPLTTSDLVPFSRVGPLAADAGAEIAAAPPLAFAVHAAIVVEPACIAVGTAEAANGLLIVRISGREAAAADAIQAVIGLHAAAPGFAVGCRQAGKGSTWDEANWREAKKQSKQDFHVATFMGDAVPRPGAVDRSAPAAGIRGPQYLCLSISEAVRMSCSHHPI